MVATTAFSGSNPQAHLAAATRALSDSCSIALGQVERLVAVACYDYDLLMKSILVRNLARRSTLAGLRSSAK